MKEFDSNTREERMAEVQCHRTERRFLPPRMLPRPVNKVKIRFLMSSYPKQIDVVSQHFKVDTIVTEELEVRVESAKHERRR